MIAYRVHGKYKNEAKQYQFISEVVDTLEQATDRVEEVKNLDQGWAAYYKIDNYLRAP